MNFQPENTLLPYVAGSVECRICGFRFLPELEEDQQQHEREHMRMLKGGLPYDLREFIKRAAWEAAECEDGVHCDEDRRHQEIAKRTVAYSYWALAVSSGIPEHDFEPYMAAHFAFIDATIANDEEQLQEANAALAHWRTAPAYESQQRQQRKTQTQQNASAVLQKGSRTLECRICGLIFSPHLEEDRERHELLHRSILSGGWPYPIREFIKRAAQDVLRHKREPKSASATRQQEIAKRAIVFARWARSVSNGLPENELEPFMAAHLASLDAYHFGDEYEMEKASEAMSRWSKYG